MTLPLHHADVVGSVLSVAGQWFIYKKKWWGWLLGAGGSVSFLYVNAVYGAWGMEPITSLMLAMSIWSAYKWGRPAVEACVRVFPHICKVNGPCNGWPREGDEVAMLNLGAPVSDARLAYLAEAARQSKFADGTLPRNTSAT